MAFNNNNSFGDASGNKTISLGQDTWNISDGYTKIKILRILIEIDLYETIAHFGYKDMDEKDFSDDEIIRQKRVEALFRVCFLLKQLLGNCRFSLEKKNMRLIYTFYHRINQVEEVIDGVFEKKYDLVCKTEITTINEQHFRLCSNTLRVVKDEMNFPINDAGLIFRRSDEVDLDKIMNDIIEGG
jgi:hypothetical protein